MDAPPFTRDRSLDRIRSRDKPWELVVIGGGATGIGVALDAASRGSDTLLLERFDFGKGTSSRSTKLVHGGVRYLKQGNITLVRDALRERTLLRQNAPHLVHDIPFVIPCHSRWEQFYYGAGLKAYDWLAWSDNFGRSHQLSTGRIQTLLPALRTDTLSGGVLYHDGQFDDARLLINMAQTAHADGATLANYVAVDGLIKENGRISGLTAIDQETSQTVPIAARCIVNAAGPFCDAVRRMDQADCPEMVAASQGVHVVLPRKFFPGDAAMIVPKTSDGRVLFIIPWHDHAIVGTTDTAIDRPVIEPDAMPGEIEFLLTTTADYLSRPPTVDDIRSVFTGIRPLVKDDRSANPASLSRDHVIRTSDSGLITITGGKWTTVRKMAEDCVDTVAAELDRKLPPCRTKTKKLHGHREQAGSDSPRSFYGTDLDRITALEKDTPELAAELHADLSIRQSDVVWAARSEMARTVEDVLARRSRALFLNAPAALSIAPEVARILAKELGRDAAWQQDQQKALADVARHYLPPGAESPIG